MCVYYPGPAGIIGYTVANQSTNNDTRQAYCSASSTFSAWPVLTNNRDGCLLAMTNHYHLQAYTETLKLIKKKKNLT